VRSAWSDELHDLRVPSGPISTAAIHLVPDFQEKYNSRSLTLKVSFAIAEIGHQGDAALCSRQSARASGATLWSVRS